MKSVHVVQCCSQCGFLCGCYVYCHLVDIVDLVARVGGGRSWEADSELATTLQGKDHDV